MSETTGKGSPEKRQKAILKKVRDFCTENGLFGGCRAVTAGVSGGADSVCLLFILQKLFSQMPEEERPSLTAVHVHHQIRGAQADADAAFTRDLCARIGVPFVMVKVDAPTEARRAKLSLEEAARNLRYEALRKAVPGALIAVAHTATDQAETVLFRLARGTGLKGLAGMSPKAGDIVRPLLCLTRQETEAYLAAEGQPYVTDSTNFSRDNARAILRADVMPGLAGINAQAVRHIADTALQLSEAGALIQAQSEALFKEAAEEETGAESGKLVLAVSPLQEAPALIARQAVQLAIARSCGHKRDIGAVHIKEVIGLLRAQTGAKVILPYGMQVRRCYDRLCFEKQGADEEIRKQEPPVMLDEALAGLAAGERIRLRFGEWETEACFAAKFDGASDNEYTKFFDYDKMQNGLVLRNPRKGDFLHTGKASRASLSKVMKDRKVPHDLRDTCLLLAAGDEVYWAVSVRRSQAALIDENTKKILRLNVRRIPQR